MSDLSLPKRYKRSFTPKLAWDFASLMEKQAAPVYERLGIVIPVIASSTLCFIAEQKKASLLEVARALGVPHQLAAQRVKILLQLGVISADKDKSDKRRTNYRLTAKGRKQNILLDEYLVKAAQAFIELNDELNVDLMQLLERVNGSFVKRPLLQRIFRDTE